MKLHFTKVALTPEEEKKFRKWLNDVGLQGSNSELSQARETRGPAEEKTPSLMGAMATIKERFFPTKMETSAAQNPSPITASVAYNPITDKLIEDAKDIVLNSKKTSPVIKSKPHTKSQNNTLYHS